MSEEQRKFIKSYNRNKLVIIIIRLFLIISFLLCWELLSKYNIINSFIFCSPLKIVKCIYNLYINNNLFNHICITLYETLISFIISMFISITLSTILFLFNNVYKIFEPIINLFNSLPKVALGPLIIIIFGANINSVIVMGILISFIVTSIMITNSFYNTNKTMIKLFKTFKSNSFQLIYYLIFPYNINTIISAFKLGISMCLIGVISGEFLISKSGLGYLIIYGTQVFNMDLVFSGISLLLILSIILYEVVNFLDYLIIKKK